MSIQLQLCAVARVRVIVHAVYL